MIIVAGTITIDPAKADDAVAAMSKMMEATHKEAGNLAYNFARDIQDLAVFHVFEKWESEEALNTHMAEPHMAEFMEAMGGFGITGTEILKYEISAESNLMGG